MIATIGASNDAALEQAADALGGVDASSTTVAAGGATTPGTPTTPAPSSTGGGVTTAPAGSVTSTSAVVSGFTATTVALPVTSVAPSAAPVAPVSSVTDPAATSTTLDGPVVPAGPAQMDEATEVARYVDAEHQVVYVSSGAFAAAGLSFEQPWVRIELARLGRGVTVDLDQLAGLAGGDPLDVAPLLGASEDVTAIDGDADVDGSPVKRYRVVVPGDEVVASVPAIAGQLDQLGASTPESFTFVVAVDAGNRIRRLTYEVSNGDRTATTDIVFRVPAEGATIEFPAEADTIDFADIVR